MIVLKYVYLKQKACDKNFKGISCAVSYIKGHLSKKKKS